MSLLEAFAAIGQRIDHSDVIKFVRDNFIGNNPSNPDWIRRQTQEQRLRLYDDAYDQDINSKSDRLDFGFGGRTIFAEISLVQQYYRFGP